MPAKTAKKVKTAKRAKSASVKKTVAAPSDAELKAQLGKAWSAWSKITAAVEARFAPLERVWFPAKTLSFGKFCRLMRKDRTFLYLLADKGEVKVTVVLGERAYGLAMKSTLPAPIKQMLKEAKVYSEGHCIHFPVSAADAPAVVQLVELKTAPK